MTQMFAGSTASQGRMDILTSVWRCTFDGKKEAKTLQPWFHEQVSKAPWAGLGRSPCVTPDCPFKGGKALHVSPLVWQAL